MHKQGDQYVQEIWNLNGISIQAAGYAAILIFLCLNFMDRSFVSILVAKGLYLVPISLKFGSPFLSLQVHIVQTL